MAYSLQIWRSLGGFADGDYTLVHTVAPATPGDPFTWDDEAVLAGQLYHYRARYVCQEDPEVVSDWSNLALVRAPYPFTKGITMGNVITAAQTQLGLGVERVRGQGVKSAYGLDAFGFDGTPNRGYAQSSANRNTPSEVSDETAAASDIPVSFAFDLRPAGAPPRMLLCYYRLASTTIVPLAGSVPEHYIHRLEPTFVEQPVTLINKESDFAFVEMGFQGNTLTISSDKTQTTPLRAQVAGMAMNHVLYPSTTTADLQLLGLDALAYDLGKYGPTDWALLIGGVQSPDARTFGHSLNRNMEAKQVGDYMMGPQSHFANKSNVSVTGNLYFTDSEMLKSYYGQIAGVASPFGIVKNIVTTEVRWVVKPPANSSGYVNQLEIVYPVCSVRNRKPVPETGPIMQDLTFQPRQDPANSYLDHYLLLTTSETAAALALAQPEIDVVPRTDFNAYNTVPAVASGTPTTTVIAAAANAYLNVATNDVYNGLYLYFITGANAGVSRLITDYVAATRTFTVGTAFGTAPAAGDKAIVIGGYGL